MAKKLFSKDKKSKKDGPAIEKRIKISKAQQQMLAAVLGASLVAGVCIVLSIYFIKYIMFNNKIIDAKEKSIANYEQTILNVGICKDKNNDGKLNEKELTECDPTSLDVESMTDTLRYNVLVEMAENQALESVSREALQGCYDTDGKKIDFYEQYQEAETDEQIETSLSMMRMCSALRAIPDALPAQKNEEALMASLNQIFLLSDWVPESLSPSGSVVNSAIPGLGTIPVSLVVETDSQTTLKVLSNIEKSIRAFDISTATIGWSGTDQLELRAQATAYYSEEVESTETNVMVYATDGAKKNGVLKQ